MFQHMARDFCFFLLTLHHFVVNIGIVEVKQNEQNTTNNITSNCVIVECLQFNLLFLFLDEMEKITENFLICEQNDLC